MKKQITNYFQKINLTKVSNLRQVSYKSKVVYLFFAVAIFTLVNNSCEADKYSHGKILYTNFCVNCHGENGENLAELIPPLANSDYLTKNKDKVACLIYYGYKGKMTVNGKEYNQQMPANPSLNDIDIANLINYINNHFGNENGYTQLKEVQEALNNCEIGAEGMIEGK
ncbi:MAG: cytochrome c [Saprospiraceae bacterium]